MDACLKYLQSIDSQLSETITELALERGYADAYSHDETMWRRGISNMLEAMLKGKLEEENLGLKFNVAYTGSFAQFSKEAANKHLERGLALHAVMGVSKIFKQVFLDALAKHDQLKDDLACILWLVHAFDYYEKTMTEVYVQEETSDQVLKLTKARKQSESAKNKYLTLFESIPLPMILLDKDMKLENLNFKAKDLLETVLSQEGASDSLMNKLKNLDFGAFFKYDFEGFLANNLLKNSHCTIPMTVKERTYVYSLEMMKTADMTGETTGVIILFTLLREVINT